AEAKGAGPRLRFPSSRRSSRFSRSRLLRRSRSLRVSPVRTPWSHSAWRTHFRNVSAEHPIFPAIDSIAAHCDAWSPWCSRTMRIARSRTSGANLVGRAMAPSFPRNGASGKVGAVQVTPHPRMKVNSGAGAGDPRPKERGVGMRAPPRRVRFGALAALPAGGTCARLWSARLPASDQLLIGALRLRTQGVLARPDLFEV